MSGRYDSGRMGRGNGAVAGAPLTDGVVLRVRNTVAAWEWTTGRVT